MLRQLSWFCIIICTIKVILNLIFYDSLFWNRAIYLTETQNACSYTCEWLKDGSAWLVMWRFFSFYLYWQDKSKRSLRPNKPGLHDDEMRWELESGTKGTNRCSFSLHHSCVSHSFLWLPAIFLNATFATRSRARNLPYSNEFCEFLQMDELRSKSREIEKLSKLLKRDKLAPMEYNTVSDYIRIILLYINNIEIL